MDFIKDSMVCTWALRSLLGKSRGFDEAFDEHGFEDCDFGRRLFRAGLAIGWFPRLSVVCFKDVRHDLENLNVNKVYSEELKEVLRTSRLRMFTGHSSGRMTNSSF